MESWLEKDFVLVGLGNPGKKYEFTRHNIGFLVASAFAHRFEMGFKTEKRLFAEVAKGRFEGRQCHVVLPTTYMNESGRAVRAYLEFHKLAPCSLLVISDDVELPFNQIRLRQKGGSGGHNGLKSIEQHLATQEYSRLKMGVGKDLQERTLADYVLDPFKPEEFALLPQFIEKGIDAIKSLFSNNKEG